MDSRSNPNSSEDPAAHSSGREGLLNLWYASKPITVSDYQHYGGGNATPRLDLLLPRVHVGWLAHRLAGRTPRKL